MSEPARQLTTQEKYCSSCGNVILKEAEICPKCGVRVNAASLQHTVSKDKTVAVVLAVFLGLWTWLYTYKLDAWKFWLNLGLCFFTLGFWGLVAWIWAIIDSAIKPTQYYANFPL